EQLKKFPSLVEKIDLEAFRDFILTTEVVFTHDDLLLNGSRKEAINYPLKRQIYINIGDWDQLLREPNLRAALVLHEFLGLMTIDDAGYELSSTILNSAGFTFPKNYSKVVAEKGSYLDSYDTLAAELVQTWDNGHGNRELTKQMSVSILQFFYGFYSVKFESEDDDQESLKTAYYLAIHLRDLLPYDIVEKAFIRLSDSAPITSTLMGWGVHIDLGMNHELVIAKDRHWGVQERFEDINFVQKLRGKNARAIGCQVSLPKASTPALPRIILRQLFAMALNCGGDYYYIDTNVNGAYPSDLEN
ncbi:MAG TPA: hypothetical protein VN132_06910, partial [Bdellovibrio sp.]|nr:hypothetical protein [Bdellovibrio sp.]